MDSFLPKNPSNKSFTDKQKSLFAHLDDAASKTKLSIQTEESMDTDFVQENRRYNKRTKPMTDYKKCESIFKRPEAPINRCLPHRRKPTFNRNPRGWTKYTLSDVSDDDISEQGNKRAALSFLKELEEKNDPNSNEKTMKTLPEKILFKKSALIKEATNTSEKSEETNKVSFRSSKLVMPEYVIGQKIIKPKKKLSKSTRGNSTKELKLDHLLDDEED